MTVERPVAVRNIQLVSVYSIERVNSRCAGASPCKHLISLQRLSPQVAKPLATIAVALMWGWCGQIFLPRWQPEVERCFSFLYRPKLANNKKNLTFIYVTSHVGLQCSSSSIANVFSSLWITKVISLYHNTCTLANARK